MEFEDSKPRCYPKPMEFYNQSSCYSKLIFPIHLCFYSEKFAKQGPFFGIQTVVPKVRLVQNMTQTDWEIKGYLRT